jgi:hypothetical protein
MKQRLAWISVSEAIDDDGFYLQDGPLLRIAERNELRKMGAPDVEEIEFVSILPEDRDSAMVEALVTPTFAVWAKSHADAGAPTEPVDNGESNLIYYDNEENSQ